VFFCGTAYADYENIDIDYKVSDATAEALNARNPIWAVKENDNETNTNSDGI
jgi:hypothetical protein